MNLAPRSFSGIAASGDPPSVVDQHGQPVIAELRIFPLDKRAHHKRPAGQWRGIYGASTSVPAGGITARLLRQVKTQAFRRDLRDIINQMPKELWDVISLPKIATPQTSKLRVGRKGRSDIELAQIAAVYEAAYIRGDSVNDAVAKRYGLSASQARDVVHRARNRGILSPAAKQGKGGGIVTSLGRAILNRPKKKGEYHGKKR